MKSTVLTLIATVSVMLFCSMQIALERFTANYQGTNMKLEWQLNSEDGIVQYEIARKRPDETNYTRLATITPSSAAGYTYIDETLYKDQQGQTVYLSYRLSVKTQSGTNTYFLNVNNSPTAVQRSWGSIKSMFR